MERGNWSTYSEGQFQQFPIDMSHVRIIRGNEAMAKVSGGEVLAFCIQVVFIRRGFVTCPNGGGGKGFELEFFGGLNLKQWPPHVGSHGLEIGNIGHEVA